MEKSAENILIGVRKWFNTQIEEITFVVASHINELTGRVENTEQKIDEMESVSGKGYVYDDTKKSFGEVLGAGTGQFSHTEGKSEFVENLEIRKLTDQERQYIYNDEGIWYDYVDVGDMFNERTGVLEITNTNNETSYYRVIKTKSSYDLSAVTLSLDSVSLFNTDKEIDDIKDDETTFCNCTFANKASGDYSHAEGNYTSASGDNSHAEGTYTTASGDNGAHAEGYYTRASADNSHAEGNGTTASGYSSHAEGRSIVAFTDDSDSITLRSLTSQEKILVQSETGIKYDYIDISNKIPLNYPYGFNDITISYYDEYGAEDYVQAGTIKAAEYINIANLVGTVFILKDDGVIGYEEDCTIEIQQVSSSDSIASGVASHVEGEGNTASGESSHSEGYITTASGPASHAEGSSTTASGNHSHAEGNYTSASGDNSHAEGRNTTASAFESHAEGSSTTASGINSHAEGDGTIAASYESHAEGYMSRAIAQVSHAEGSQTTTIGNGSHAEGNGNIYYLNGTWTLSINSSDIYPNTGNLNNIDIDDYIIVPNNFGEEYFKVISKSSGYFTVNKNMYQNDTVRLGIIKNGIAEGFYSHVEGDCNKATNRAEHAEGSFNKSHTDSNSDGFGTNSTRTLHSIGIGTADNSRKNAVEVMQNGDAYLIGVGNYDGIHIKGETGAPSGLQTLQEAVSGLKNISITLSDNTTKTYQVKEGMTWFDWVNSDLNTDGFVYKVFDQQGFLGYAIFEGANSEYHLGAIIGGVKIGNYIPAACTISTSLQYHFYD